MNLRTKITIICVLAICLAGVLWSIGNPRGLTRLTYSEFLQQVRTGQVASVIVLGGNSGATEAICRLKDGNTVRTVLPADYRDALLAMEDKLVNVTIQDSSSQTVPAFSNAAPFLPLLGAWIFVFIRRFPNGLGRGVLG